MGMGYGAVVDIRIDEKVIDDVTGGKYSAFIEMLKAYHLTLDEFAEGYERDDNHIYTEALESTPILMLTKDKNLQHAIEKLYDEGVQSEDVLQKALQQIILEKYDDMMNTFEEKTDGLEIAITYHDSEETGSSYDEIDGAYFWVSGKSLFQETDAAKKLKALGGSYGFVRYVTHG